MVKGVSEHIAQLLRRIPEKPGVYQHLDAEGTIIYVGKAKNLRRRVNSYFQKDQPSSKTRQLVANIADIRYVVVESEQDAFLLENNLIKQYQPRYNILLKDGKSYPSICITREEFPRIFKTRTIQKGLGEYYGPYSFGNTVDIALELIHQLFPIRTCTMHITSDEIEKKKHKVCLKY
ncbi:MAG: GIY-YIG nuclease family protein, partial [Paludibacteraceae bacterium]|nr:GIY-YIG nuclease family protein [Paludibacteraceae bacterium]